MENFTLEQAPAPKRRTAHGAIERPTIAYYVRNQTYDCTEAVMRCWNDHEPILPPKAARLLGVKTTAEFVRMHRPEFRGIMRLLELSTAKELLRAYGRTGERCWQWDHAVPVRTANHFDHESMGRVFHAANLRPRIACRNKRRKWEAPVDHAELFGEGGHES